MTKKIGIFLTVTFVFSWCLMSFYSSLPVMLRTPLLLIVMFGPTLGVVVANKALGYKLKGKYLLKFKFNVFVVIGMILPLLMAFDLFLINLLLPNTSYEMIPLYSDAFSSIGIEESYHLPLFIIQTILNGILLGISINAVFAFGEEYGWRGFLQKELAYLGNWKASMITGAVWGVWHAPLVVQGYNFPDHPYIGVFMMTIALIPLGVIMSYLTVRSGTILTAAFFHGVLNATAGVSIVLLDGYVDIYHGPFGVTAILLYSIVAITIYYLDKKNKIKSR